MPRRPRNAQVIFPTTLNWSLSDTEIAQLVGCRRWYANYMRRKLQKRKPARKKTR